MRTAKQANTFVLVASMSGLVSCVPKEIAMIDGSPASASSKEFSSVNFWSERAEDAIDAAQRRRDGTPYAFLAGPSWVQRDRRKTVPVFACQGGTSADYRRGSLGSDGTILLVDLGRHRLFATSVDHKEYSFESAPEPPDDTSDSDSSGFGACCTPLDLESLFPGLLQSGGLYRVLAIYPGGLVDGFELEVGKSHGEHKKSSKQASTLAVRENPIPTDAWSPDESPVSAASGFALALDSIPGKQTLRLSVPSGPAEGERKVHLAGLVRGGSLVVWTLSLPATNGHSRFRLDMSRLFPSLATTGGWVVGISQGSLTTILPVAVAGTK